MLDIKLDMKKETLTDILYLLWKKGEKQNFQDTMKTLGIYEGLKEILKGEGLDIDTVDEDLEIERPPHARELFDDLSDDEPYYKGFSYSEYFSE